MKDTKYSTAVDSGSKLQAVVEPSESETVTVSVPSQSKLQGTSIAIAPGSLQISTNLVVEEGVSIGATSLLSEASLPEDVTISGATEGIIIRPTENVLLSKPLQISLPLPTSTSLALTKRW